ncbi:MAG: hypothetical protein ACX930_12920 [Erythrobacter sp.]
MGNTSAKRGFAKRAVAWLLVIALIMIGVAVWANRAIIGGYGEVGTAYAARVACSCRFVAGRNLESCKSDKLAGMEMVSLSDDVEAKSVTARLLLVSSTTATYREGYGCVLEKWDS